MHQQSLAGHADRGTPFMNRRNFLAGSIALAGHRKLINAMAPLSTAAADAPKLVAPHNLLSTTYTESFLTSKLVAAGAWHPYPNWTERAPWESVPEDIRTAIVARAESDLKDGWKALLASRFLDFKRNGNRTR